MFYQVFSKQPEKKTLVKVIATAAAALAFTGCTITIEPDGKPVVYSDLTTQEPARFVRDFQEELLEINKEVETAYWVRSTYITSDTALLASKAGEKYLAFLSKSVDKAKRYDNVQMDETTRRAIDKIIQSTSLPSPNNSARRAELAEVSTEMEGIYGSGKACDANGNNCRDLGTLEKVLATSRDYQEQLKAWSDWRTVSVPMRDKYARFVELANEGAKDFGFKDLGNMWKSGYDMPVKDFEVEVERLWGQVEPLYEQLHCYVRSELSDFYGVDKVNPNEPIPAHLLGNMWAQTWSNIYPIVEPYPGVTSLDITQSLKDQNYSAVQMTEVAEGFFTSLGLPELPDSFYQNSLLTKPADRDVVCHASAWDMGNGEDPRIKQCVEPTEEHLSTLHHELGHIYYFLMYKDQQPVFKTGAHDGFHEAIGDTIVLSMTPEYLKQVGLIEDTTKSQESTINEQMKIALDKIAFLPFGKLIDQWRWQVFAGEVTPENYNKAWWDLREQYQGIAPAIERTEADFDPGAKYHIPGNTPYTRYFLSFVIQFQFYKSMCEASGHTGPLHECSFFGSKEAGEKLGNMLALGASKPWKDAMEQLTGTREMDAAALVEYFNPLLSWLEEKNQNQSCGW